MPAVLIASDIPRTNFGRIAKLAVRDIIHGGPAISQAALANPEALRLFEGLAELREVGVQGAAPTPPAGRR